MLKYFKLILNLYETNEAWSDFILEKSAWQQYGAYIKRKETGGQNTVKRLLQWFRRKFMRAWRKHWQLEGKGHIWRIFQKRNSWMCDIWMWKTKPPISLLRSSPRVPWIMIPFTGTGNPKRKKNVRRCSVLFRVCMLWFWCMKVAK